MVKLFTDPQNVTSGSIASPRLRAGGELADAITGVANSALNISNQFIQTKNKRLIGNHIQNISDVFTRNLNAQRSQDGLPDLTPDELGVINKTQAQINRINLKKTQRNNTRGVQAELMALQNNVLASNPGLRMELEQAFQGVTGQSTGSLGFSFAADPMATDIANDVLDLANPDHARIKQNAEITAANEFAINSGLDTTNMTQDQVITRAREVAGVAFDQAVKAKAREARSGEISLATAETALNDLRNPGTAAGRQAINDGVLWWDQRNPNRTNAPRAEKLEAYSTALRLKDVEVKYDAELRKHQKRMEMDATYRATTLMRRAVDETYAKYSGDPDFQDTPYSERFDYVMQFNTKERDLTLQTLRNNLDTAVSDSNPITKAQKIHEEQKALAFVTKVPGASDPNFHIDKAVVDEWYTHEQKIAAKSEEIKLRLEQITLAGKEKEFEDVFREAEILSNQYPTMANGATALIERDLALIPSMSTSQRSEATARVDQRIADVRLQLTNQMGKASPALEANLKALEGWGEAVKKRFTGEYDKEQYETQLSIFRAITDFTIESVVINPNAATDQQISGRTVEKMQKLASFLTKDNEGIPFADAAGVNSSVWMNILTQKDKGFQESIGGISSFEDVTTAYEGMTSIIGSLAESKDKSATEAIVNAANNFIVNDYLHFTKNGEKELSADQLQVMGQASFEMLQNPNVAAHMATSPAAYNGLKDVTNDYVKRVQDGAIESVKRVLNETAFRVSDSWEHPVFFLKFMPKPGVKNDALITQNISPEGVVTFAPAFKDVDQFVKRYSFATSESELRKVYDRLKSTAARLNNTHAAQLREFGVLRSNITGIDRKQATKDILEGIGIFDEPIQAEE